MSILEKNIQALVSGVNEPLARKLIDFFQNSKHVRFSLDENLNIFDQKNQVFMYSDIEQEIAFFQKSILEKTLRYPFVCIYGVGNALLIKNLTLFYKHIFIFESEIELFVLALSVIDLSEELRSGKIYLVDTKEEKINAQLSLLFDQNDMFEYLGLYEMFMNSYYKKYFIDEIAKIDRIICDNINLVIRNLDPSSMIPLKCYDNFIQNIPAMLKNISFQRIIQERKNQFKNCIVVCAGPSLEKQIPLLKKYQENFVIFCADGAFPLLHKNDITPDYVLNLDCQDKTSVFFKNIKSLDKTLFVFSQSTHFDVIKLVCESKLNFSIVLSDSLYCKNINMHDFGHLDTGTHVGHMCYALALALGFKNIVIIGQDLAYNKEGNSHFNDFILGKDLDSTLNIPSLKILAYGGEDEVLTHLAWDDYRKKLEFLFANNTQAKFYNATEGGARIAFTKELSFEECCLKFGDEKKKSLEMPKILTLNRSDKLLKKVLENLKKDLNIINQTLEDAKVLKDALEKILSSNKALPLEFLLSVYKNIEHFNSFMDNNSLFQDRVLKGVFFKRGLEISKIILAKIAEEEKYLFLIITAYKVWLVLLIEKLNIRKESLQKII
ncbi:motility associated factor glycosyltransferase family protein [Campylobacter taeniopygiae]|uniref:Motility accessory factor n=1 Tax=Campylobacter taeniopygiae TaxID=2510188 RepID=A0ABY2TJJ3_9BACT|nr:motility associated factor glycosyltransferase family protein [Campylobacter taeniopygiae]TKX34033.1 motility accessory factor [Campylobacter taeniopygiae]